MKFRMRRITPGVVFLTALLLILAIACGPSAEQSAATDSTEPTTPPQAPLAASAASAATAEARTAAATGRDGTIYRHQDQRVQCNNQRTTDCRSGKPGGG